MSQAERAWFQSEAAESEAETRAAPPTLVAGTACFRAGCRAGPVNNASI